MWTTHGGLYAIGLLSPTRRPMLSYQSLALAQGFSTGTYCSHLTLTESLLFGLSRRVSTLFGFGGSRDKKAATVALVPGEQSSVGSRSDRLFQCVFFIDLHG